MSHSYSGPSGTWYHLDAEGSIDCSVAWQQGAERLEIPMRDILWLAALHKRNHLTNLAENASDFEILGLPQPEES